MIEFEAGHSVIEFSWIEFKAVLWMLLLSSVRMQKVGLYRPSDFIKLCIGNTSEFPSLTTKPEITNDGCDTLAQKETWKGVAAIQSYLIAFYSVIIHVVALNTRAIQEIYKAFNMKWPNLKCPIHLYAHYILHYSTFLLMTNTVLCLHLPHDFLKIIITPAYDVKL